MERQENQGILATILLLEAEAARVITWQKHLNGNVDELLQST